MNRPPWRAGLLGCGAIGSVYDERRSLDGPVFTQAGMFSTSNAFELICIADPDSRRRQDCAQAWRVEKTYASHQELLRHEQPQVVGVATPDDTHEAILEDILDLGQPRAVFLEKPLARSAARGLEIGLGYEAAGIALVVNYVRRYDETHRRVRDFVARGGLGRVHGVCAQYVRGLRHNGCHAVNLLRFLFGEPLRVRAVGLEQGSMPLDPSLDVRLEFPCGLVAQLVAMDRLGYCYSVFELEISGDAGRLRLDATAEEVTLLRTEPSTLFPNFSRLVPAPTDMGGTYGNALRAAARELDLLAADPGLRLENHWREALRDLEIIEAAMASAMAQGAAVELPPFTPSRLIL